MRKLLLAVLFALIAPYLSLAQAAHQAGLTWVLSTDDTTANCAAPNTCSQNVYRVSGACTATTSFTGQAPLSNISATAVSFTDSTVNPGQVFCYAVTFVLNGVESSFIINLTTPVNAVTAKVRPFTPSGAQSQ